MPDQTMRERVTEVIAEAEASYERGGWEEHLADAALTALAAHDRTVKAEAWDEGHNAGWIDSWAETHEQHVNPYRIGADRD